MDPPGKALPAVPQDDPAKPPLPRTRERSRTNVTSGQAGPSGSAQPDARHRSPEPGGSSVGRVKVFARVRPPLEHESYGPEDEETIEIHPEESRITITYDRTGLYQPKDYYFDSVLPMATTQTEVYDKLADVVDDVLNGYNGTILAYGQTGSGKTYTMFGKELEGGTTKHYDGIVPSAVRHIFNHIAYDNNNEYRVTVSYVQIYIEMIQDLLRPESTNMQIREDPDTGVFISGVCAVPITSEEECMEVVKEGDQNRVFAFTKLNAHSSRSHACLVVTVEKRSKIRARDMDDNAALASKVCVTGKLFMVDLAGSERTKKSGAQGVRMKEANAINYSLSALGNCIFSLTDDKAHHIPYRDSKLTRLLQDSLGGNAKTCLVVNICPTATTVAESVSTVMFGQRAMKVQNHAKINMEIDFKALAMSLQSQVDTKDDYIAQLEMQLNEAGGGFVPKSELEKLKAAATKEIARLREKAGESGGAGGASAAERDRLVAELEEAKKEVSRHKELLREKTVTHSNSMDELYRLRERATTLEKKNAELAETAKEKEQKLRTLMSWSDTLVNENNQLDAEMQDVLEQTNATTEDHAAAISSLVMDQMIHVLEVHAMVGGDISAHAVGPAAARPPVAPVVPRIAETLADVETVLSRVHEEYKDSLETSRSKSVLVSRERARMAAKLTSVRAELSDIKRHFKAQSEDLTSAMTTLRGAVEKTMADRGRISAELVDAKKEFESYRLSSSLQASALSQAVVSLQHAMDAEHSRGEIEVDMSGDETSSGCLSETDSDADPVTPRVALPPALIGADRVLSRMAKDITRLKDKLRRTQERARALSGTVKGMESALQEAQDKKAALELMVADHRGAMDELTGKTESQVLELQGAVNELAEKLEEALDQKEQLAKQLRTTEADFEGYRVHSDEHIASFKDTVEKLKAKLKANEEETTRFRESAQTINTQLQHERTALMEKLTVAVQQKEDLSGEMETLKFELHDLSQELAVPAAIPGSAGFTAQPGSAARPQTASADDRPHARRPVLQSAAYLSTKEADQPAAAGAGLGTGLGAIQGGGMGPTGSAASGGGSANPLQAIMAELRSETRSMAAVIDEKDGEVAALRRRCEGLEYDLASALDRVKRDEEEKASRQAVASALRGKVSRPGQAASAWASTNSLNSSYTDVHAAAGGTTATSFCSDSDASESTTTFSTAAVPRTEGFDITSSRATSIGAPTEQSAPLPNQALSAATNLDQDTATYSAHLWNMFSDGNTETQVDSAMADDTPANQLLKKYARHYWTLVQRSERASRSSGLSSDSESDSDGPDEPADRTPTKLPAVPPRVNSTPASGLSPKEECAAVISEMITVVEIENEVTRGVAAAATAKARGSRRFSASIAELLSPKQTGRGTSRPSSVNMGTLSLTDAGASNGLGQVNGMVDRLIKSDSAGGRPDDVAELKELEEVIYSLQSLRVEDPYDGPELVLPDIDLDQLSAEDQAFYRELFDMMTAMDARAREKSQAVSQLQHQLTLSTVVNRVISKHYDLAEREKTSLKSRIERLRHIIFMLSSVVENKTEQLTSTSRALEVSKFSQMQTSLSLQQAQEEERQRAIMDEAARIIQRNFRKLRARRMVLESARIVIHEAKAHRAKWTTLSSAQERMESDAAHQGKVLLVDAVKNVFGSFALMTDFFVNKESDSYHHFKMSNAGALEATRREAKRQLLGTLHKDKEKEKDVRQVPPPNTVRTRVPQSLPRARPSRSMTTTQRPAGTHMRRPTAPPGAYLQRPKNRPPGTSVSARRGTSFNPGGSPPQHSPTGSPVTPTKLGSPTSEVRGRSISDGATTMPAKSL